MLLNLLSFAAIVDVVIACVATVTTTAVCCPILSTTSLPKRNPTNPTVFHQCSILRRMSSTCPVDGIVFCDAAQETNPTTMQVEFFNAAGAVVRTVTGAPPSLVVNVYCVNGAWHVRTSPTATTTVPISTVSCAQTGSTGADRALIPGTAVN
ncbi:hypothetical protein ANCCEY_06815 [Ancylostoma ceylanicum]|uniref:C6 domain-containing protein n=2 Tax=Ancylostoma ceylanicum TaxID=53326 RepID=A0A0D6LSB4_9BILA|nr:hypothetical protein ANCCEY_06815 [Ancylostoma ceylanicum]EYC10338.1 hypothetical protein Y032_0056g2686 [Ancylostoma ceylanicum]